MSDRHVTQIRLRSSALQPTVGELDRSSEAYINDGLFAKSLADRVEPVLTAFPGVDFDRAVEDHDVHFYGKHDFELHVVCTSLGAAEDHEHLVLVEPARKPVRPFPWLKSYTTAPIVPDLVDALRAALENHHDISDIALIAHDVPF